jgi:hypothetical protein
MASIYKPLGSQDVVSTKTLLHEAIPITGSIVSGSYADANIKDYAHGMFQSVYDYPYLSSSANHIFDIAFGTSTTSPLAVTSQTTKKDNIYNQMAQVLVGFDKDGNIQNFDEDGDLTGGAKMDTCIFLPFSRLLVKDEIKKQTFSMRIGVSASFNEPFGNHVTISDADALTNYRINSPAGEYGILYATSSKDFDFAAGSTRPEGGNIHTSNTNTKTIGGFTYWRCGLIYYQAGVVVLTGSLLQAYDESGGTGEGLLRASAIRGGQASLTSSGTLQFFNQTTGFTGSLISEEISGSANAFRRRIDLIEFNNTVELNSTIHFCRLNHNEFNYSSNPTYLSGSNLRIVKGVNDQAVSYITSVGLYSADNQLLAVGKMSEPIRKDPSIELTFRTRLDY